jgi:transketolase
VIASDGDMMEGVSAEAASLAGDLHLGRLIVLYDANQVTLSGTTNITFSEDVGARFAAYGWQVQDIDGMDIDVVDAALTKAHDDDQRPSLIIARTHIGYGSPNRVDSYKAHGEPLGKEETRLTKRAYGWPEDAQFLVPDEAKREFAKVGARGTQLREEWQKMMSAYRQAHPDLARDFDRAIAGELRAQWDAKLPVFTPADGEMATRDASAAAIQVLAESVPNLVGGSADLDPSTRTAMKDKGDFQSGNVPMDGQTPPTQGTSGGVWGYAGRNIHFGIREHAMGSTMNGMALYGSVIPFGGTFQTFSDYMRPAIRLAALSHIRVLFVFTHDSIGLGEDGPTHQSVEHLAALRAIPNLAVIRPCDAAETREAWRAALLRDSGPTSFALSRQKVMVIDRKKFASASGLHKGAYVLAEAADRKDNPAEPQLIIIATGSEIGLAMQARESLNRSGIPTRVVSMPCWEFFEAQSAKYKESVLSANVKARLAIEAGVSLGWSKYIGDAGDTLTVDRFGASAPAEDVFPDYGFTVENVIRKAKKLAG